MKTIEKLEDLTPDPQNANEGTLRGSQLMARSIEAHGAARSIVADKNGLVVAGNKALEAAVDRGLGIVVVESDGQTLVVVRRGDLDINDPRTRELAYLDNRTSEIGLKWSPQQLEDDLGRGVELGSMFEQDEREAILKFLDQAEVQTNLKFDDQYQHDQFLVFLGYLEKQFSGGDSIGAKMARWATEHLALLDPQFEG